LITRLESYTNDVVRVAPTPRAATPDRDSESRGAQSQVGRDVTLGLFAIGYLGFVLFDDVESPLLSMALIFLVAYALIQPHVRNR
jgi:hypothetical protein